MNNKDLISQYADTGLQIPDYQITKLSNNDKKTYLRKRLILCLDTRTSILSDYEYSLITDENDKKKYDDFYEPIKNNYINQSPGVLDETYCLLPDSFKDEYNNIWWRDGLEEEQYKCMNDEMRYWLLYRYFNWYDTVYGDYKTSEFIRLHDKFEKEDPEFRSLSDDSNFIKLRKYHDK